MIRVSAGATLFLCASMLFGREADPPAPVPPAVISRDAATGRATVRAIRLTEPLREDGRLDESVYAAVPPISDFVQMEPHAGAPATERTDLWILFDRENVYVTFRLWESHPERIVAKEMRRDSRGLWQGDNVAFLFDTFHDGRNGVEFGVTPTGGRYEGQVTNERSYNGDWNPVWKVSATRFEHGWIAETAIPFQSLRYRSGDAQVWGFQARRVNAWKNELSFLTGLPPSLGMGRGIFSASLAPALVGLEVPEGSKNIEIKPYARVDVASDASASPPIANHLGGSVGLDVKYGLTRNLTADFTVNPDFAQAEADDQQINLTRFNLFFPEKREFFLENPGIFTFGGSGSSDTPILFYSRRIGLDQEQAVPIEFGSRLTGRIGRFTLGVLDMESGHQRQIGARPANYSVFRVTRDILRRSTVGVIATGRSRGDDSARNVAYGIDGTFAFFDNLTINTYWAQTKTQGLSHDDASYRAQLDYSVDRYGVRIERLAVGSNFNPEIGFVRRPDMRKTSAMFRFSPRPHNSKRVRKFYFDGSLAYITDRQGRLETKDMLGEFIAEFQTSDRITAQYERDYEFIPQPFVIAPDITVPAAGYNQETVRAQYTLGTQRRVSGTTLVEYGRFYGGRRAAITISGGRANVTPRLSLEPVYSFNRVTLSQGNFSTQLAGSRITYTLTPLMFVSSLVQFNSTTHSLSTSLRFRWEYRPGSELFVVYNDERDMTASTSPPLNSRGLVVKINRLLRF